MQIREPHGRIETGATTISYGIDRHREAFNHAFAVHAGAPSQEEAGHRIAQAVKRRYMKLAGEWVARL